MNEPDLRAEVERLRGEVEGHRQRELSDLRTALAVAQEEAKHFRIEAQRNADLGRQIFTESQKEIAALRAELDAIKTGEAYARRFPSSA